MFNDDPFYNLQAMHEVPDFKTLPSLSQGANLDIDLEAANIHRHIRMVPFDQKMAFLQQSRNASGDTILIWAAYHGHTPTIEELLEGLTTDQKVEVLSLTNLHGETALLWAAFRGYTQTVETLLKGLNVLQKLQLVNQENHGGISALRWASCFGYTQTVDALLKELSGKAKLKFLLQKDHDAFVTMNPVDTNTLANENKILKPFFLSEEEKEIVNTINTCLMPFVARSTRKRKQQDVSEGSEQIQDEALSITTSGRSSPNIR